MSEINLKNYSEIEWGERVGQYEGVGISKISGGNGGVNEWESTLGKHRQGGGDNYGNKVISYPEELGQIGANERLQNYVFFDIYDTGGEKLTTEKNNKNLVNLEELAEIAGKPFQTLLGIQGATGGGAGDVQASTTSNEDILNTGAVGALLGLIGTGTFSGAAAGFFAAFGVQEYGGKFLANVIRNKKEFFNQGYVDDLIEGKTLESFNSAALGLSNRTQRIGLSIALPMPAQINTNYGLEYEEPDFNGMGTMMAGIRAAAGENTQNAGDVNSELRRKIGSVNFSVLDSLGKIVGSDGINFNQYAQASLREAPNRFSEKTFKGVERRKFNFEWDFSPRSVKDAKTIASIIYAFKKYSHPKLTKGGLYLDYPAQFRIGFFNKLQENDYLFKIGLCACTKCDITYGGDELGFLREIRSVNGQNSDFAVGAPANTVKMELEFSELELLTRQRIQTGY